MKWKNWKKSENQKVGKLKWENRQWENQKIMRINKIRILKKWVNQNIEKIYKGANSLWKVGPTC